MIKFDYKFLKIYKKIRQKGEEDETMVRDHQKCHHVVAAWTVSHNPCPDMSGSMLAIVSKTGAGGWVYIPGFFFGLGGSGTVAINFIFLLTDSRRKRTKRRKIKYRLTDTCNDTETKGRFI